MSGCACIECVQQSDAAVVERWGGFSHTLGPGMNFVLWPVYQVAGTLSLKVQQLEVKCETKTLDNVFIEVIVAIQYNVLQEKVSEAFYELTNPRRQITAYVYDVVRSTLPKSTLEEAYASKNDIANAVQQTLDAQMFEYGYKIVQTLVTDMMPEIRVKTSFNDINASMRMRMAQAEKAEAEKIMQVKAAEAEAEAKYLSGQGVAKQRAAIVDGLRDSIADFSSTVEGTTPKDIMDLLLITQYFDMLKDVGSNNGPKTLFLPHGPDSVAELQVKLHNNVMRNMGKGALGF